MLRYIFVSFLELIQFFYPIFSCFISRTVRCKINYLINYFRCSSIHLAVKTCLIYEPSFIFLILWPLVSKEHYTYAIILMWHNEGLKLLWNRNLGNPSVYFRDIFSLYRRLKVWWHLFIIGDLKKALTSVFAGCIRI